ncbi:hypothetical protein HELRODRAFT_188930 [Helobdella robusta]|uniref:E3 UFM1-protein ligase 1 homolog n=1 Tax=Helobdella robusta TaxID=6412 RepID=T1FQH7_HELRO|nr:hypothetical protein HELRODRAFT_188930 [Helobdella robusta]ESN98856.1 hypothetical protein HELRODRAFT_188930 [Helobdella robusta]
MATADWEEIKRLATDFQRVQLSSSVQKLSERNCIEIVQRLIELKILNVIYTTDGKEYLTPKELTKEILEELAIAGGRINLVDLQQKLNVDLLHIEAKVNELMKTDKSLKLILGQLIDKSYFDRLSEEINDKLQEQGLVTISELAKHFNFPGDVLKELISERLETIILGKKDLSGNELYTDSYIDRHRSLFAGMFNAITRPTPVFPIITKYGFQETLAYNILDKLIESCEISGSLTGSRPHNVTYTPNIYIKSQQQWVNSFYNQNSYIGSPTFLLPRPTYLISFLAWLTYLQLPHRTNIFNLIRMSNLSSATSQNIHIQSHLMRAKYSVPSYRIYISKYDCLTRLGISDAQGYIKKRFKNDGMEYLKTCCLGPAYKERILVEMEEALEAGMWFNLMPHLPSICTLEDAQILINTLTKKKNNIIILSECYLISSYLVDMALDHFKPLISEKAQKTIQENPSILMESRQVSSGGGGGSASKTRGHVHEDAPLKDNKRKKVTLSGASKIGGGGAGSQAREVKMKATKKKYLVGHNEVDVDDDADHDNDHSDDSGVFMTISEITDELMKLSSISDAPADLLQFVAVRLARLLNNSYSEELKNIFVLTLQQQQEQQAETDAPSTSIANTSTTTTKQQPSSNQPPTNKKKLFADVSDKASSLYSSIKMFGKGVSFFKDDVQYILIVHLLRTLCTDLANLIFSLYAADLMVNVNSAAVSAEDRNKIISSVQDDKTKSALNKLNSALSPKVLDDFYQNFENICSSAFLNITLKRDKKKERQQMFNHKQSSLKDLQTAEDPALVLHICSILLFQTVTQSMLHCPGKFVPHVIIFLKDHLTLEHHHILVQCQDIIIRLARLTASESNVPEITDLKDSLASLIKKLLLRNRNSYKETGHWTGASRIRNARSQKITSFFNEAVKGDKNVSEALHAVDTLIQFIKVNKNTTLRGLNEDLMTAINILSKIDKKVASVTSACDMFVRAMMTVKKFYSKEVVIF